MKMKILISFLTLSSLLQAQELNLSLDCLKDSPPTYSNEKSLVFLNADVAKISHFLETPKKYQVLQTELKHKNPYLNYMLQLAKALSDNEEKNQLGQAISQNELNEIIKKVQDYQLKDHEILEVITHLSSSKLGIHPFHLDDAKKSFYQILKMRKRMNEYESLGSRCRFITGDRVEDVSHTDSPINSKERLNSLDAESQKDFRKMKESKENFIAASCRGGLLVE